MDIIALDNALVALEKKKVELEALDYNDPKYDQLEEELHGMEDAFQDAFGEGLDKVFQDAHQSVCPDNDVLLPIAYLGDGIIVESDEFPGKDTSLVFVSSPPRILLKVGKETKKAVWGV